MTTENYQKGQVTVNRNDLRTLLAGVNDYGLAKLAAKVDGDLFTVISNLDAAVRYAG
jgi:hypothetical protein